MADSLHNATTPDPSAIAEPELEVIPTPPPAIKPVTPNVAASVPVAVPAAGAAATPLGSPPYLTPVANAGGLSAPGYLTAIAGNRSVLLSWYPSEGTSLVSGQSGEPLKLGALACQ